MANPLSPMNWLSWSVDSGAAGIATPWVNQGGSFQVPLNEPKQFGKDVFSTMVPDTAKSDPLKSQPATAGFFDYWIKQPFSWGGEQLLKPYGLEQGSGLTKAVNEYFIRGVVIVLGFIFVAGGLALMGKGAIVETVKSVAK